MPETEKWGNEMTRSTKYKVKFDGVAPVLITRIFTMNDGEKIEHTSNIEYAEAKAIAEAFNTFHA